MAMVGGVLTKIARTTINTRDIGSYNRGSHLRSDLQRALEILPAISVKMSTKSNIVILIRGSSPVRRSEFGARANPITKENMWGVNAQEGGPGKRGQGMRRHLDSISNKHNNDGNSRKKSPDKQG